MTTEHLDARRLLCPMPVIRVQDRVKTLVPGTLLEVVCTDPGAAQDVPTWCRLNGHRVESVEHDDDQRELVIRIRVGGG